MNDPRPNTPPNPALYSRNTLIRAIERVLEDEDRWEKHSIALHRLFMGIVREDLPWTVYKNRLFALVESLEEEATEYLDRLEGEPNDY